MVAGVAAGCGGTEDGALLTVVAVDGPGSAARIELLLANAGTDTIQDVDNQRVRAGDLDQEGVRYYRQRAIAGEVTGIDRVDGFRVRIEPNEELVTEKDLIPFLVAYDEQGQISGIGSFLGDTGEPAKIEITSDVLRVYEITMVAMTEVSGETGIAQNEALAVSCTGFKSGLAFNPGNVQLRLLLPDRSQNADATDASDRDLDMDCDLAIANSDDCDDLRSEFHRGALETCDGMDYDCDFRRLELVTCGGLSTTCGETEGVAVCMDTTEGGIPGTCLPSPECECGDGGACSNKCVLAFDGPVDVGAKTMCDPQINQALLVPGCDGNCIVEVLDRGDREFAAEIALENDPNFTTKLTNVTAKIQLRVEHIGANPVTAGANTVVGAVFLAVTPLSTMQPVQIGIALQLNGGADLCEPGGHAAMLCVLQ